MEKITLKQTSGKAVRFTGELVGYAETSANTAASNYSGDTGRWEEYYLYKTAKGKYVGKIVYGTLWQGERDVIKVKVFPTLDDVFAFFGDHPLALELYEDAGLDYVEEVE